MYVCIVYDCCNVGASEDKRNRRNKVDDPKVRKSPKMFVQNCITYIDRYAVLVLTLLYLVTCVSMV